MIDIWMSLGMTAIFKPEDKEDDLDATDDGEPSEQALAGSTISIPGFSGRDFVKIPGSRDFRDRD